MLFIKSLVSKRYAYIVKTIVLLSEIISPCSHYIAKGLVYITITALSTC